MNDRNKCIICNIDINPNRKVCSIKCLGKYTSIRQLGKNNPSYKHGNSSRHKEICKTCGKDTFSHSYSKNYFCSKICKNLFAKTLVGELSATWKDNTNRRSIAVIAKRYLGNSCAICGWNDTTNDSHHIIEVCNGGKNKLNNTIILCPNHHRLVHENKITKEELIILWKKKYDMLMLPGGYCE